MKTQRKTFVIILVLLFSSLSLGIFSFAIVSSADTAAPATLDLEPMRLDADFQHRKLPIMGARPSSAGGLSSSAMAEGDYYEVGDIWWWYSLDNYYGYYYWTQFELRAMDADSEVWVQTNLSYGWDIFGGEFYDPRDDPVVSDANVTYLLGEFSGNIVPTDSAIFGAPDFHDGEYSPYPGEYNGSARNVILVSNVKDTAYYYESYPYYVAGFYSSAFEYYFDRNIITIDSHDWLNRVGYDAARANLYESIIAHEFQHLIHDDYNPDDPYWMNEGCSLIAEPLCGYAIDYGQVQRFLFTPDNSLTLWGDQGDDNILADYGSSFLWTSYIVDHYGGIPFLTHFVQNGIPGIAGIEATLAHLGYTESFMEIYHDWRIANLLDLDSGKYSHLRLDLDPATNPELEGVGLTVQEMTGSYIPWTSASTEFGTTWSLDGDDTYIADVSAFGSEYLTFPDLNWLNFLFFDGDNRAFTPGWELTDSWWYSGSVDLANSQIIGEAYVDPGNPLLEITTYWDLEYDWDFGFVQVSTDGGATWTSLVDNEGYAKGIDENIGQHPDVLANLPGLTGWSGGDLDLTYDLSPYAGMDVLIGFLYLTDWAYHYDGWYIEDDVQVSGTKVELRRSVPFPEADFMVTVVKKCTSGDSVNYYVRDVRTRDFHEIGILVDFFTPSSEFYLIVSPIVYEWSFADYRIMSWRPHGFPWWHP